MSFQDRGIDVILPLYKPNFLDLERCIDSLNKQTYKNFIVFFVEDPSEVDSKLIQKRIKQNSSFNYSFIRNNQRLGLPSSLNEAIFLGKNEFIARVDVDDFNHPKRFERQIDFLSKNPDVTILGSWLKEFRVVEKEKIFSKIRKYPLGYKSIVKRMAWHNPIAHPTVMLRRSLFGKVGYYNNGLSFLEDWELWFRATMNGEKIQNLPDCLVEYQVENQSIVETNIRKNLSNQIKFKNAVFDEIEDDKFRLPLILNIFLLKIALYLPEKLLRDIYYKIIF